MKKLYLKTFPPSPVTNPCLDKIWRQLDRNSILEMLFFLSFIAVVAVSYFTLDEDLRNYPVIVVFCSQVIFLFFVYPKKLLERKEYDKEWFKTKNFEKITLYYITTRKNYIGNIFLIVFLFVISIAAPYSIEIVSNYDKEVNENLTESLMDATKQMFSGQRNFVDTLVEASFILPWMPVVFLINLMILKGILYSKIDFEYYFSYVILKLIVDCKEGKEPSKFSLFKIFLNMYEEFIKTSLRLFLFNKDKIYSNTIANSKKTQDEVCQELLNSFENEDKYAPLKYLNQLIDGDIIIKKPQISEKIRLLLPLIPVALFIINFLKEMIFK